MSPVLVRAKKVVGACGRSGWLGILLVLAWLAGPVGAAEPTPQRPDPAFLVGEALQREYYGQNSERARLIAAALDLSADYAPARWQAGYFRVHDKWVRVDDLSVGTDDGLLLQYRDERSRHEETVASQIALARWCAKAGLPERARAHYSRVLALSPDYEEARVKLGFRRVAGKWAPPSHRTREERLAIVHWRQTAVSIVRGLDSKNVRLRQIANDRLRAIHDPAAIAALEDIVAVHSEEAALAAIDKISGMSGGEASGSLATIALTSLFPLARQAATEQLKQRPEEGYMPLLLSALSVPRKLESRKEVGTSIYVYQTLDGVERHVYSDRYLELRKKRNHRLASDANNPTVDPVSAFIREDRGEKLAIGLRGRQQKEYEDRVTAILKDARVDPISLLPAVWDPRSIVPVADPRALELEQSNKFVTPLLAAVTGKNFDSPEEWWAWWREYNDMDPRTPIRELFSRPSSCLVAGTPVWTESGPRPIEGIRVGDLVVAQDPRTGELALKPVTGTTVRDAPRLVSIDTIAGVIHATAGHFFWVSGNGWVRARDLKSGMLLHGIDGTVIVSEVNAYRPERVYNLVVADFNTYFVGDAKVLSHDVTMREPTDAVVPGLAAD